MAVTPLLADYTDKDFDSVRLRLINLIASVFPEWTDFNTADFGTMLLEVNAHVADLLAFLLDNHAAESRLATATQRRSLLALVKLIAYVPRGAGAALADEVFTLAAPAAADVVLPKGTKVRTEKITNAVFFQLLEDLTIPAGQTTATATVEHSAFQQDVFTSTGKANQEIVLKQIPYLDGSAQIATANGAITDWEQVSNFLASTSTDKHFVVIVDQSDKATLRFGTGVNGVIPTGTISATYKTGGGTAGRLEANSLKKIDGNFTDENGNPVTISANNPSKTDGGTAREGNEEIRQNAPLSLRVLERAVAREDFEIVALTVPGVARALMTTKNEDAGIGENAGILYVVPDDGGAPTQALKDEVASHFSPSGSHPSTLTFSLVVQDPVYLTIDVEATLFLSKGAVAATVKAAVLTNLTAFFALRNEDGTINTAIDFGFNLKQQDGDPADDFALSDLFNAVRDTEGVRKIGPANADFLLNGEHDDVAIASKDFPRLGTVVLRDGDTGQVI
jgi:phage-related baseplate assembly protein